MVDANQAHVMPSPNPIGAWSYEDALTVARAMEKLDVLWLEEPLPRYNTKRLTRLAAEVDIPIAGGELNIGLHEYKTLVDMDCYDIIRADAAFSEGIFQEIRKGPAWRRCPSRNSYRIPGQMASGWEQTYNWLHGSPTVHGLSSRSIRPPGRLNHVILCWPNPSTSIWMVPSACLIYRVSASSWMKAQ